MTEAEINGLIHERDTLRGQLRGFLTGRARALLVNGLEAANAEPPFMPAVKERFERVIQMMDDELKKVK